MFDRYSSYISPDLSLYPCLIHHHHEESYKWPINIYLKSVSVQVPVNESISDVIPVDSSGNYEKCQIKSLLTNQTTPCSINGWTYGDEFDSTILTEVHAQRNFPVNDIGILL